MTISMFKIICVTDRKLCREPFLTRIEKLAAAGPDAVILREKDLSNAEYAGLAASVSEICRKYNIPCILHGSSGAAAASDGTAVHFPADKLRSLTREEKNRFSAIGVSCHSAAEAEEAVSLGASYITAGHIFDTECKAGTPGRGTDFLREICRLSPVPVYAIGGISPSNIAAVRDAGADGAMVMSPAMTWEDPAELIFLLRKAADPSAGEIPAKEGFDEI